MTKKKEAGAEQPASSEHYVYHQPHEVERLVTSKRLRELIAEGREEGKPDGSSDDELPF